MNTKQDLGGTWAISWTEAIDGLSLSDIERCSIAALCRLSKDSYTERWFGSQINEISAEVIEVLDEKNVGVVRLDPPRTLWLTQGRLLYTRLPYQVTTNG